jgi:hypothetical protein
MMFHKIDYNKSISYSIVPPSIKSLSHFDLFKSMNRELVQTDARARNNGNSKMRYKDNPAATA